MNDGDDDDFSVVGVVWLKSNLFSFGFEFGDDGNDGKDGNKTNGSNIVDCCLFIFDLAFVFVLLLKIDWVLGDRGEVGDLAAGKQ